MPMTVPFFPRQLVAGNQATAGVLYSDVFDVSGFAEINAELRVLTSNPATGTINAVIEGCYDPTLGPNSWAQLTSMDANTTAGAGSTTATISNPAPYVRAKLSVPAATYATIELHAVAREAA